MGLVRSIAVEDSKGDELTVYEFQDKRFLGKVRRLKLCTGEPVQARADGTFELRSGEVLRRAPARS